MSNRKGVTAIFNLTEPGEHPHCGDGLEKTSGFPYLPESFMREGSKWVVPVNTDLSCRGSAAEEAKALACDTSLCPSGLCQ